MFFDGNQREYTVIICCHFKPLYTSFLRSIQLYAYTIGITFDKDPLTVEGNNYLNKIVKV